MDANSYGVPRPEALQLVKQLLFSNILVTAYIININRYSKQALLQYNLTTLCMASSTDLINMQGNVVPSYPY